MTRNEIEQTVIAITAKAFRIEDTGLTMETRWKEDLNARSAHIMKLLALTKMKFNVDMTPKDAAALNTLNDLANFVEGKM